MTARWETVLGRVPVLECLRTGKRAVRRLHVQAGATGLEAIVRAAGALPVETCDKRELDRLARGVLHQGVVLEAAPLPVLDVRGFLAKAPEDDAVAVVLDGVEDPHNFGAIVRSAAACGACAALFAMDRSAPLSPAMVKAAAGGVEYLDLVRVPNLVRAIGELQEAGFRFAVLDARAPANLWDADLTGRVGLVIGSEGKGVRRLVRARCDLALRIPLAGPISSLNASVSAAAALVECLRQRTARPASRGE